MSNGCLDPSPQIDLTFTGTFPAPRALRATPILSPTYGNGLENKSNGMYTPSPVYLPGSQFPSVAVDDGTLVILYIGGQSWMFRYNFQTDFPTDPWEFIGGAPNLARRDAQGTHAPVGNDTWQTTLTGDIAGPSVTLPVAGVYLVEFGHVGIPAKIGSRNQSGVSVNGADPTDNNTASVANAATAINGNYESASRMTQLSGLSAGDVVSLRYRDGGDSGTSYFNRRWIAVTPVRCH